MADFVENDSRSASQALGTLVVDNSNTPDASEGFTVFDSVGFMSDGPFDGVRVNGVGDVLFYYPEDTRLEVPDDDPIDYFTFTPDGVDKISINFRIFEDENGFSALAIVPVTGVSAIEGHTVYNSSAPEDDPGDDQSFADPAANPSFEARDTLRVTAYDIAENINPQGLDRNQYYGLDPVGGEAHAIWTLTGEPVTFAVFGFNADVDLSSANPDDFARNTISGELLFTAYRPYVVHEEAEYRIRLFPTEGEAPQPRPSRLSSSTPPISFCRHLICRNRTILQARSMLMYRPDTAASPH